MLYSGLNKKISSFFTALFSCGLLIFSPISHASDLNQIQKQIKQQESKIAEQKREQAKLQANLKNHESKINAVVGELHETEMSLKEFVSKFLIQINNSNNWKNKNLNKNHA